MSWFSNILKPASDSISTKKSSGIQVYLSIDSTKVCYLTVDENAKPPKILSWEEWPLGPIEDLQPGEAVRDLFGSLSKLFTAKSDKFNNLGSVSVSIPADGIFFKNVEVAKLDKEATQRLVFAEVKKSLPVDFSQILFAQNDLGEKKDGKKNFLCVGIQKIVFENYKSVFAKFNINPYIEIEVFSLARIVKRDDKPKLIIQMGRSNTFLIFTDGQVIQDVRLLEIGQNEINKEISKKTGFNFGQAETLIANYPRLLEANRMGARVLGEYFKNFDKKIAEAVAIHIMDYEKRQLVEVQEVIISGNVVSNKIKKEITDGFDSELKVDFVNEENFSDFQAENFPLEDLKRFAQCFGLALRAK